MAIAIRRLARMAECVVGQHQRSSTRRTTATTLSAVKPKT